MTSVSMAVTEASADVPPAPPVCRRDWRQWLADQATSGWLISLTLHLLLMLLLALWSFRGQGTGIGEQTLVFSTADGTAIDEAVFQLLEPEPELSEQDEAAAPQALQPLQRAELPSGFAPPLSQIGLEAAAAERNDRERSAELESWRESLVSGELLRGGAVEGRRPQRRKELVARFGGSAETERAVELGLTWLAAHQHPTMGYWSLGFSDVPCEGRCTHPGETLDDSRARFPPQSVAATGLALLAFLGAGYTHEEGPYQSEVLRGLYFLQQVMQQEPVAGRFPGPTAKYAMYEQGIATLALCEAYQMSRDDDLKDFAQRGLDFIAHAQLADGGWGYEPRLMPGDLSIAAWQVMAMKSGMAAGLTVYDSSIRQVDLFLDSQQSHGGAYYGYRQPGKQPGTTAMGLLIRMYRGWGRTDPRLLSGVNYLVERGPSESDIYYNYYAQQLLFHREGPEWEGWNRQLSQYLVQQQATKGHELGSWFFPEGSDADGHNRVGGRLYCTALALLTLEVYYRHLPLYRSLESDHEFRL
jgi:hypothetical protein